MSAAACSGIATIAETATPSTYTVTGVGPGQCTITFSDSYAQSVVLPVSVTTSAVVAR